MQERLYETITRLPRNELDRAADQAASDVSSQSETVDSGRLFTLILVGFLLGALVASSGFLLGAGFR